MNIQDYLKKLDIPIDQLTKAGKNYILNQTYLICPKDQEVSQFLKFYPDVKVFPDLIDDTMCSSWMTIKQQISSSVTRKEIDSLTFFEELQAKIMVHYLPSQETFWGSHNHQEENWEEWLYGNIRQASFHLEETLNVSDLQFILEILEDIPKDAGVPYLLHGNLNANTCHFKEEMLISTSLPKPVHGFPLEELFKALYSNLQPIPEEVFDTLSKLYDLQFLRELSLLTLYCQMAESQNNKPDVLSFYIEEWRQTKKFYQDTYY